MANKKDAQINPSRKAAFAQPICADREFARLETANQHEFIYCGFLMRRNPFLFRLECRPVYKFDRTGLVWFEEAVSDQVTHEVWCVYQRRQQNAPIRLLFRHQYDFGLLHYADLEQSLSTINPALIFHRYREIYNAISRVAEYVTGSLAITLNSITGQKHRYLERRALSELLPDREVSAEEYNAIVQMITLEHSQHDFFWALQAQYAFCNCQNPDNPIWGYPVD